MLPVGESYALARTDEDTIATQILHIGLPKTATTWLRRHVWSTVHVPAYVRGFRLPQHSAVLEAIVLSLTTEEAPNDPIDAYADFVASLGAALVVDEALAVDVLLGHAEVSRVTVPARVERLKRVFPEGRVVLTLRDVDAWLDSLYGQYVRTGGHLARSRFSEVVNPAALEHEAIVAAWEREFPVHVLQQEHLARDPDIAIKELAKFCGLSLPAPMIGREHEALAAWKLPALRVVNRLVGGTKWRPGTRGVPGAGRLRDLIRNSL